MVDCYNSDTQGNGEIAAGEPIAPPPQRIARRYELGKVLGSGRFGRVHRARDLLRGEDVAVKLLTTAGRIQSMRREVVALRSLRLPGVVRLIDEGVDRSINKDGQCFLVMELVTGAAFPGSALPAPWHHLGQITAELLTILGRVHNAGVLHLDLKPANILVTPTPAVVLLDLGIASGPALGGAAPSTVKDGTVRYMAPEHKYYGEVDVRSDLYSVGVMLGEALTGHAYVRGRALAPADATRAADVPAAVWPFIERLCAHAPQDRPASAWEALDELERMLPDRPTAFVPALPPGQGPLSAIELHQCFAGPERLFHVPSDAARALWERTCGDRDAVVAELRTWIRLGRASFEPNSARLHLDPSALAELLRPPAGKDLHRLLLAGQAEMVPQAVISTVEELITDGAFENARALIQQALRLIRQSQVGAGDEARLLSLWTRMALEERNRMPLEIALYELERAAKPTPEIEALETLVRCALHEKSGDNERAQVLEECLASLPAFAALELERWRYEIRLRLARGQKSLADEERVRADMQAWADAHGTPDIAARVLDSMGWLEYRRLAFERAAILQERASRLAQSRTVRLASMLNGASALMEAAKYDAAEALARAGQAEAEAQRYPLFEARAAWILRALQYRTDCAGEPDRELVQAAQFLDVAYLEALIALNEGAVAWRAGLVQVGIELAALAEQRFEAAGGMTAGQALAAALRLACLGGAANPAEVAQRGSMVVKVPLPLPDSNWQVLGMLAILPGGEALRLDAHRLASQALRPNARRELLAPQEVLSRTPLAAGT